MESSLGVPATLATAALVLVVVARVWFSNSRRIARRSPLRLGVP